MQLLQMFFARALIGPLDVSERVAEVCETTLTILYDTSFAVAKAWQEPVELPNFHIVPPHAEADRPITRV